MVHARCSSCGAFLVHNSHPSELKVFFAEYKVYLASAFLCFASYWLGLGAWLILVAAVAPMVAYTTWAIMARANVPADWPRHRLAPGEPAASGSKTAHGNDA